MTLFAVTQSSGQGHETVFPQIVASELGIDPEQIRFHPSPPAADLVGNGTGGSRGVLGTGSAFKVLGEKLVELARPHAAKKLGVAPEALRYGDGAFHAPERSIGFVQLARQLASATPHPLNTVAEGTFGTTFPNGCHIAEVEIDPESGTAKIERYTAVDDLGHVINPTLVEGQVHGGVTQGAGQVFGEHAVYDAATGQLLTASFSDYFMPHAGMLDGRYFAAGYCGHGIAMATALGDAVARRMAGDATPHPLMDGQWPEIPLYRGTPWFLPMVGACYRVRDWLE